MAKLKSIPLPDANETSSSKQTETIIIDSGAVNAYCRASDAVKAAQEIMEEHKEALVRAGLKHIFAHNCAHADNPDAQVSTVKLQDSDTSEALNVIWSRKNNKMTASTVESAFKRMLTTKGKRPDINEYVAEMPEAEFDASVFMADGVFDEDVYLAFTLEIADIATRLGVKNPLTCKKVAEPKADFHDRRWIDFSPADNLALQKVMPTTVMLKPVRPVN